MIGRACRLLFMLIGSPVLAAPFNSVPTSDWVVTNWQDGDPLQLAVTNAHTNSPSVASATGVSLMAGFPTHMLKSGQEIRASGLMTIAGTDGRQFDFLQYRLGLFHEAGDGPATGDGVGYTGFMIVSSGFLNEARGPTNPFTTTNAYSINNSSKASPITQLDGDFTAHFSLHIRRTGNQLDIDGLIDDGNMYREQFVARHYVPMHVGYSFNRIGFFSGRLIDAEIMQLADVQIVVVPEPSGCALACLAIGALAAWRRRGTR